MNDIFPGYVQIPASEGDETRAKWLRARAGMFETVTLTKIERVDAKTLASFNRSINASIHYAPEQRDDWQKPRETLARSAGDCEDYAILKYAILYISGVPETRISLVLGEIAAMPNNLPHAFLVIEIDGKRYVLDNKFDQLIDPKDYINWQPKKCTNGPVIQIFSKGFVINDVIEQGHA